MPYWKFWEIDSRDVEPGEETTCFFVGQFEGRTEAEAHAKALLAEREPNPATVWASARVPVSEDPAL